MNQLAFTTDTGGRYVVTAVVEYKTSPNHFVLWQRNRQLNRQGKCPLRVIAVLCLVSADKVGVRCYVHGKPLGEGWEEGPGPIHIVNVEFSILLAHTAQK